MLFSEVVMVSQFPTSFNFFVVVFREVMAQLIRFLLSKLKLNFNSVSETVSGDHDWIFC